MKSILITSYIMLLGFFSYGQEETVFTTLDKPKENKEVSLERSEENVDVEFVGHPYGIFNAIIFDNNGVLYASSKLNQVLISADGGKNWDIFYSFPDNLMMISKFSFPDKEQPTHLYFMANVVGGYTYEENGLYVLDTKTKELVREYKTFENDAIVDYEVDLEDPSRILAVTSHFDDEISLSESNLYFTQNAGESWRIIRGSGDEEGKMNHASFDPYNKDKVFVSHVSPGGVSITENLGRTWRTIDFDNQNMRFVAPFPSKKDVIIAGTSITYGDRREGLFRSDDGGESWKRLDIDLPPGTLQTFNTFSFSPRNSAKVIVAEEKSILYSYDYGLTWEVQHFEKDDLYYYGKDIAMNPLDDSDIFIITDKGVIESRNSGGDWNLIDIPYMDIDGVAPVKYSSGQEFLYYTSLSAMFARDLETGKENTDYERGTFGFSYFFLPDSRVNSRVITARTSLLGEIDFFFSDDHGESKEIIHTDIGQSIWKMRVDPNVMNRYWISMKIDVVHSKILRITVEASGFTIEEISVVEGNEGQITDIDFANGKQGVVYASVETDIYKSVDDGVHWEKISNGLPFAGIWSIAVNPDDDNEIIASLSLEKGLYKTQNGGLLWEPVFTEFELQDVEYVKEFSNTLISRRFGKAGVIISEDDGETWNQITEVDLDYISGHGLAFFARYDSVELFLPTNDMGIAFFKVPLMGKQKNDYKSSINRIEEESWLDVYFNQDNGEIIVKGDENESGHIRLIDLSGKEILKRNINLNSSQISVADLKPGVYLLKISGEKGRTLTHKFNKLQSFR
ncbi:MAG: T9SS type A sorting domain-containing protein [Bacteroidales bacterium]